MVITANSRWVSCFSGILQPSFCFFHAIELPLLTWNATYSPTLWFNLPLLYSNVIMQLLPLVEFSFNLSLAKMFPPAIEDIFKIIYIKPLYIIFYFNALKFLEFSSEFPLTGPSSFICVFLNSDNPVYSWLPSRQAKTTLSFTLNCITFCCYNGTMVEWISLEV